MDNSTVLNTAAIRLSFPARRPFYPYSEPSDRRQADAASPGGRALRVSILSDQRMTAALDDHTPWPGKLEFSGSSVPTSSEGAVPPGRWLNYANLDDSAHHTSLPAILTTMSDESNPRPGTADLYFSPDPDQSDFVGPTVDFDAPVETRVIYSHSLSDFIALLLVFMLPGVPLYCGWKVLHLESGAPASKPWLRPIYFVLGALAIGVGAFFAIQFVLLLFTKTVSALLGWWLLKMSGIWLLIGLFAASGPVLVMSWGVIACGVRVWRSGTATVSPQRRDPFDDMVRRGSMAAASLAAGGFFLLAMVEIVFSLLKP
jgi:hypothetical protein